MSTTLPTTPPPAARPPRRALKITGWILGAVLALSVIACGAGESAQPDAEGGAPAAAAAAEGATEGGADTKPKAPAEQPKIGVGSHKYPSGLTVAVIKAEKIALSGTGFGADPGDVGVKLTVKITNSGDQPFDAALLQVKLRSGADQIEEEQVFDVEKGLGSGIEGTIAAGSAGSGIYGFGVPKANLGQLTVNVAPGWEYDEVGFVGGL